VLRPAKQGGLRCAPDQTEARMDQSRPTYRPADGA
jgi:hypothetical protein